MEDFMSHFWQNLKPVLLVVITGFTSLFSPIQDVLQVLLMAFLFNIFAGIATDSNINKTRFCLKKAFESFKQLLFYVILIYFIHNIFDSLGNDEWGHVGIKWITMTVVYFYMTNILRNTSLLFPKNKAIEFIYIVLTTRIFEKLKNYLGINKNDIA